MKQIRYIFCSIFLLQVSVLFSQSIDIKGIIVANEDISGIHVLNISAKKYTISGANGTFEISAKLNDTILFRSVQYEPFQLVIDEKIMDKKYAKIYMTDRVNHLDEVVVGKILTGNLLSDIENSDAKQGINFYDVGIPGYTGRRKTQSERRLAEADSGKFLYFYGVGFAINVHKILNRISGRTKEMIGRVFAEEQVACIDRTHAEYSELLFDDEQLAEHLIFGFYLYVSEDSNFGKLCKSDNRLVMYEFLVGKLMEFQSSDELLKN